MAKDRDTDSGAFGLGAGCMVHGDEAMRECTMCGGEFCRVCFPRSLICPDCAEDGEGDEEQKNPDFEDVEKVDDLLVEQPVAEEDEEEEEDAP